MRVARLTTLAAMLASVLLLPACGQKGPLYLPQDASLEPAATSPSSEDARPANSTEKQSTAKDEAAAKR